MTIIRINIRYSADDRSSTVRVFIYTQLSLSVRSNNSYLFHLFLHLYLLINTLIFCNKQCMRNWPIYKKESLASSLANFCCEYNNVSINIDQNALIDVQNCLCYKIEC